MQQLLVHTVVPVPVKIQAQVMDCLHEGSINLSNLAEIKPDGPLCFV